MYFRRRTWSLVVTAVWLLHASLPVSAVVVGQVDTFESGTTEGWFSGGGPFGATPPVPPANVSTGGPGGLDDNFLRVVAIGGGGPGGRLTVINISQWAGNYVDAGIGSIQVDLNNFGASDLYLRLLFSDPFPGPPINVALSAAPVFIPGGSGWVNEVFSIGPGDLTSTLGSVSEALANATELRIFHSPTAAFPGKGIVASLGVDNITAVAGPTVSPPTAVPEPSTLLLGCLALALSAIGLRSRHTRSPGRLRGGGAMSA